MPIIFRKKYKKKLEQMSTFQHYDHTDLSCGGQAGAADRKPRDKTSICKIILLYHIADSQFWEVVLRIISSFFSGPVCSPFEEVLLD